MKKNGFTLIELIVAIGLSAIFIPAVVYVYSFSLGSASSGEKFTQAYAIAQQQMEAIYYLKSNSSGWDWVNAPLNTGAGEFYQPKNSGGVWYLGSIISSGVTPDKIDGYTPKVEILPGETLTSDSRKIIVRVAWEENGIPSEVSLMSYVTKH